MVVTSRNYAFRYGHGMYRLLYPGRKHIFKKGRTVSRRPKPEHQMEVQINVYACGINLKRRYSTENCRQFMERQKLPKVTLE